MHFVPLGDTMTTPHINDLTDPRPDQIRDLSPGQNTQIPRPLRRGICQGSSEKGDVHSCKNRSLPHFRLYPGTRSVLSDTLVKEPALSGQESQSKDF
jgi:hypothetical protein